MVYNNMIPLISKCPSHYRIAAVALCTLLIHSCTSNTADLNIENQKIKNTLQARQNLYAQEVLQNCRNTQIIRADKYVDSLISVEFNFRLNDSIIFPEKPLKPAFIGKIIVPDTIRANPIFGIEKEYKKE